MLHMLPLSLLALLPLTTSVWAAPACSVKAASSTTAAASSATGSVQTSGSSNNTNSSSDRIALAWYAGWTSDILPIADINWSKYTHMQFSFGVTQANGSISMVDSNGYLLPDFVQAAKENNVKAILTIGGWTGSIYFSTYVATKESRAQFIKTLTDMVTEYDLDGLDFDWEYPGKQGIGCNKFDPTDTENFLQFLTELRATDVMKDKVMSAAAAITPFNDATGNPSSDVSGFAKVLNHLSIMNYDVYGVWSVDDGVGPMAPLDDSCGVPGQQGSATSAVKKWTDAGFPASQLVLGVPAYGRSYLVSNADATAINMTSNTATTNSSEEALPQGAFAIAAYPSFDPNQQPMGDSRDKVPDGPNVCGQTEGLSGVWNFGGMIGSFLNEDGTALPGVGFRYDECSQTPYVYNKTTQTMVSYDDPTSFAAKGKFIVDNGLAGFAMWEASGDYKDLLVDSIRSAAGM